MTDFEIRTEQYYLHVDPANSVLATTRFGNIIMPNTWVRNYGRGRVAHCSLAHTPEELRQEPVLSLLTREMKWAAREPS